MLDGDPELPGALGISSARHSNDQVHGSIAVPVFAVWNGEAESGAFNSLICDLYTNLPPCQPSAGICCLSGQRRFRGEFRLCLTAPP